MVNTEETFPEISEIPSPSELRPEANLFRDASTRAFFGSILATLFSFTLFIFLIGAAILPAWCVGGCVPLGVWAVMGPGDYFKRIVASYFVAILMWLPAIFIHVLSLEPILSLWPALERTFLLTVVAFFASQAIPLLLRWLAGWHLVFTIPAEYAVESQTDTDVTNANQFSIAFLFKITTLIAVLIFVFSRLVSEIDSSNLQELLIVFFVPIAAQTILLPAIIFYFRKRMEKVRWYKLGLYWGTLLFVSFFLMLCGFALGGSFELIGGAIIILAMIAGLIFAAAIYGLLMFFDNGYQIETIKRSESQQTSAIIEEI